MDTQTYLNVRRVIVVLFRKTIRGLYIFFVISLLVVNAFLICSSGTALAQCEYLQDYTCTVTKMQDGELDSIFTDCMELCYDGFNVYFYDAFCVDCLLYPIDGKNFMGTAATLWGWAGCSVELNGRSLTAKVTFIQDDDGYVDIIRCTPCNDCCF